MKETDMETDGVMDTIRQLYDMQMLLALSTSLHFIIITYNYQRS